MVVTTPMGLFTVMDAKETRRLLRELSVLSLVLNRSNIPDLRNEDRRVGDAGAGNG